MTMKYGLTIATLFLLSTCFSDASWAQVTLKAPDTAAVKSAPNADHHLHLASPATVQVLTPHPCARSARSCRPRSRTC